MTSTLRLVNGECQCGRCQARNRRIRANEIFEASVEGFMSYPGCPGTTHSPEWPAWEEAQRRIKYQRKTNTDTRRAHCAAQ